MALLEVAGLTKRFGGFTAVDNVSFSVAEGEILGLLGPNGSGKSTTFNCIAGMLRPSSGSVKLAGEEIAGLTADATCRRGIGRTFQIPRPFRGLSLLENAALAAHYGASGHITREEALRRAREALRLAQLPEDPETTTQGLGAAGLKKLELARALATQPKLLLADESLGGLDAGEMRQAAEMLKRIRDERGITIVWVEHIMGVLLSVVDRVVVLDHGAVIFQGTPYEAQEDAKVAEVYLGPPEARAA
ncbi:ABC transporter ATP-binding protein [Siccirubricoccus sp. KC 17139]|uniref:ABC transporter ATP-binding protein n=1 Tax=Siccirubricoccus soli TaxID=2899147 RepID=A0ABT1CZB5_9PROT|nr:ABC transporter ATP-binding protein [Siccirubricoccus soli]MCO6415028.1 ABC transporter ATP-binding protein [Siccirubricoccus soli]MCP2681159.1 ABC transporter ATP-binding protein [Siccirubricoccus soli]